MKERAMRQLCHHASKANFTMISVPAALQKSVSVDDVNVAVHGNSRERAKMQSIGQAMYQTEQAQNYSINLTHMLDLEHSVMASCRSFQFFYVTDSSEISLS